MLREVEFFFLFFFFFFFLVLPCAHMPLRFRALGLFRVRRLGLLAPARL